MLAFADDLSIDARELSLSPAASVFSIAIIIIAGILCGPA